MKNETIAAGFPVCFFVLTFLSFSQCSSIEDKFRDYRPAQTYQCDFHDRPLILTGWSGKMAIRRYTMKDPSRGTVIRGIRRYAQHCEALPLKWEKGAKESLASLKEERNKWALITFFLFLMSCAMFPIVDYLVESLERKANRKKEEEQRKYLKIDRQTRLEQRALREKELEVERERSRRAHMERLERKAAKRKLYETNRLKNLEKRKSQNVT